MTRPELPPGFAYEPTDEHDGTGGGTLYLRGPTGERLTKFTGLGWSNAPFYNAATYAEAYARGWQDARASM